MRCQSGRIILMLAAFTMLLPVIAWAGIVQLPQTGQSECYNAKGAVISCTDTGQDGDLRVGGIWPYHRFTPNADDTITDNLTGLVWAKDATTPKFNTCTGDAMTWQAALDYIKCLNTYSYLGYSDWRLPNVIELESLVHAQQSSNSSWLNSQGFVGVEADFYWSSTSLMSNTSLAQSVFMGDGTLYSFSGHKNFWIHLAWPVRSGKSETSTGQAVWKTGQTGCYDGDGTETACANTGQDGEFRSGADWPSPRFAENNDGTVTDNLTGLIWTKDANTPGTSSCVSATDKTWQQSLEHIDCLNSANYLGFNDWRLPNRKELLSLVDFSKFNPSISEGSPFVNVKSGGYWSSSSLSYNNNTHFAWFIDMGNGYIDTDDKSYTYGIWPLRAGEYAYAAISISPDELDFGNVNVGATTTEKILTISNIGNADLQVSSIDLTGDDYSMFSITADSCSSLTPVISAGSSCTVKVTFTAASVGAKTTTLNISSNDPVTSNLEMMLGATGVQKTCACTISPKSKMMGASGGTGYLNVNLKSACDWTSASDADWLAITSGSTGSKTGKVAYTVSPNTEMTSRTGTITVEGKTFTLVQQGLSDLSVTLSDIAVTKAGKYYRLTGNVTAVNTSEVRVSGVTIKVYLSDDAVYDTGDKVLRAITVGTLTANGKRIKSLSTLKTQDNPSGKYIVAVVDPADKIREADETNNTAASDLMQ